MLRSRATNKRGSALLKRNARAGGNKKAKNAHEANTTIVATILSFNGVQINTIEVFYKSVFI